ncbi:DUF3632 domain-containing protein [Aspergillus tanneri]|uniref:Uncharacterized protein n=1 Tax=Aspergillus tanneri TaxID=1220188 RepID=A0A5M9N360_9EURO|nr:uncharacterized protein ATNIH1004_000894 [Aspergillus tanneri]KAA8651994.1 hypothetical protein ATNIH1004_000894 [Aspergillus tanneri]
MHDLLRDSPRDSPSQFLVNLGPTDQVDVDEAARQGQFNLLRSMAHNKRWFISHSYCRSGDSLDSSQPILHSLWYIYYQCSKYISYESTEQDRLVLDILRTRGQGPLMRPAPSCGIDIARTPDGAVWNDLPFLATDMTNFWVNNCAAMSANQRLNVASFLAKLASTRVVKDKLCQIALILFSETFESLRRLGSSNEPSEEEPRRTMNTLTIAALLPSACAWIKRPA